LFYSEVQAITSVGDSVFSGTHGSIVVWHRPFSEIISSIDVPGQQKPFNFRLEQNFANPFNPTATIKYDLSEEIEVKLAVYTIHGEIVLTLVSGMQAAGAYSVELNAGGMASGADKAWWPQTGLNLP
jgi:hypothetical protein